MTGQFFYKAARFILGTTLLWAVCFTALISLELFPVQQIIAAADIFQLLIGLLTALSVLGYLRFSHERYAVLGTSLAIFSWTIGQLFWFSYTVLTGSDLPYPSVGDFGFTGTYFLLIGVLGILIDKGKRKPIHYAAFLILMVPILLFIFGDSAFQVYLFNFILSSAVAYAVFRAAPLYYIPRYRLFVLGLLILAVTDIVFMSSVVLFPEGYTITSAPLYPIALSLIAYGMLRGEVAPHD